MEVNIKPCSPLILPKGRLRRTIFSQRRFFDIDAAEMGVGQAHVFVEVIIGFFAAAYAGFLFGSRDGIPFLNRAGILQQNIAAAGIGLAFGNNGDIVHIVIALRIFPYHRQTVRCGLHTGAGRVLQWIRGCCRRMRLKTD